MTTIQLIGRDILLFFTDPTTRITNFSVSRNLYVIHPYFLCLLKSPNTPVDNV